MIFSNEKTSLSRKAAALLLALACSASANNGRVEPTQKPLKLRADCPVFVADVGDYFPVLISSNVPVDAVWGLEFTIDYEPSVVRWADADVLEAEFFLSLRNNPYLGRFRGQPIVFNFEPFEEREEVFWCVLHFQARAPGLFWMSFDLSRRNHLLRVLDDRGRPVQASADVWVCVK